MKRLIIIGALVSLTACTPREIDAWLDWNAQDPAAAQAFANLSEVQENLRLDTDQDGVVEPDVPEPEVPHDEAPSSYRSRWDDIAQCESGGNWSYPLVTNRTGTYSGGLMIWTKAWAAYGGQAYAPNAYQASKAEQIVVAERILADNGWGAWDCA